MLIKSVSMSNRSKQQQNQIKIAIYGVLYFMVLNRLILRPLFTPQSKIQLKISLIMVNYPVMKLTEGHMTRLCFIKISLDYDLDQNCAQISFQFYLKTLSLDPNPEALSYIWTIQAGPNPRPEPGNSKSKFESRLVSKRHLVDN